MLLKWIDPDAVNRRYDAKQYEKIEGYFQNLYYNCVLFNIDSSESGSTSEDMGLLKYSITNMIEELAAGHFLLRWVDYSAKQIVYICNFEDDDRTALKQALDTIQNVLTEHFKTVATVAVGVTVDDTGDLPQSLQSAKQALGRRFSYGVGTVTFCDEAVLVSTENARYPQEQESQLLSAIRSGDLEETHRQLAAFFECIRPYRMESILMCLLQLDLSFQKLEGANHLDRQSLDLTQVYTSAMTLNQLSGQFESRAKTVVDLIQSIRENNTDTPRCTRKSCSI